MTTGSPPRAREQALGRTIRDAEGPICFTFRPVLFFYQRAAGGFGLLAGAIGGLLQLAVDFPAPTR